MIALIFVAVIVLVVLVVIITAMLFRRVVATNEVHIIQSAKKPPLLAKTPEMAILTMSGPLGFLS